jgi:hypothetical protein
MTNSMNCLHDPFEHSFMNNVESNDGAKERPMVAERLRCLSWILAEAKSGSRSLFQGSWGRQSATSASGKAAQ